MHSLPQGGNEMTFTWVLLTIVFVVSMSVTACAFGELENRGKHDSNTVDNID